jgi:hypothetical protein
MATATRIYIFEMFRTLLPLRSYTPLEMASQSSGKASYTELELQRCFEIIQGDKKVILDP